MYISLQLSVQRATYESGQSQKLLPPDKSDLYLAPIVKINDRQSDRQAIYDWLSVTRARIGSGHLAWGSPGLGLALSCMRVILLGT